MAIKKATQTDLATKNIQESDLLDLWKYFQDRADMLKERQWTVGTWILTLLSGIFAFSLSQETLTITQAGFLASKPVPAIMLGIVGLLICGYGYLVILDYGKHIQRNWDRANQVKEKIIGLDLYWKPDIIDDKPGKQSLPKESIYVIVFIAGFLILFIGICFMSAMALF